MKNIIDFLHDSEQARLRKISQLQTEKFEETIDSYKKIFISNFYLSLETEETEETEITLKLKENLRLIEKKDLTYFFEKLKEAYIFWLKSNSIKAVETLKNLIIKYGLETFSCTLPSCLLFRGRKSETNLNKFDMFHIPYDKRYLITNQRYSLTGIPFLYLGTSIYDIVQELNIDPKNIENLKISYFHYKDKEKKIFNITNSFYRCFNKGNIIVSEMVEDKIMTPANIKKMFLMFILSSVCSFEKKGYNNFTEEYILPQILTQALVQLEFNGIKYSSTKFKNKENDHVHNTRYKDNIAIFTDYNDSRHYDVELYNKFEISHPISKNEINFEEKIKIEDIRELIKELEELKCETKIILIALDFCESFDMIKVDNKNYFDHPIGEFHIFMVYNFLVIKKNDLVIKKTEE